MQAEIIAVGTELTTGAKLDTNSQWLSLELAALGIPVRYHSTVADDLEAMVDLLRVACNRSDIVLITGGLGPTLDDLTRQALAALVQSELVFDETMFREIDARFTRHGRVMPERNRIQAMFPEGSLPLPNPCGTAPGIWLEVSRKTHAVPSRVGALPGVPSEMKRMFHEQVRPRLPPGNNVIRGARLNCFGVGESHAEEMLGDLTRRGRDPDVGITAHEATITLRITAHGATAEECNRKIDVTKAAIRERMGSHVFGEEDMELEHVLIPLLLARRKTLAVAEWGTGGLLVERIVEVNGALGCFLGSLVVQGEPILEQMLGVDGNLLRSAGPASGEVTGEIAACCRRRFGADFALATSAFPVDNPEAAEAPAVYVALDGEGVHTVHRLALLGDSTIAKSRTAKAAMNLLRLYLLNDSVAS